MSGIQGFDAAQCELRAGAVSSSKVTQNRRPSCWSFTNLSSRRSSKNSVAATVARWNKTNKCILNMMLGAQAAMLEEVIFAGKEILDRVLTETHLFRRILLENGRGARSGRRPENDVSGMQVSARSTLSAETAIGYSGMESECSRWHRGCSVTGHRPDRRFCPVFLRPDST